MSMIKTEMPSDTKVIRSIHVAAFGREDEAIVVEKLRELPEFVPELSFIAEFNGSPVGHALLFPVSVISDEGEAHQVLSLCPMAVLPEYQRRGVGGTLVREGLKVAAEKDYTGIIVQCNGDYYPRFGFLPAGFFGIKYPINVPVGTFLAKEMKEGSLAGCSGMVHYPEPFGINT